MDLKCVLISDFEKVCRICMKFNKTFLSINSFKIVEMIIACASVQIWENDDLPNQICNECFLQLQNTINFKQLCENSDNAFRQIIEQNKNNLWNNQNDSDNVKNEELDVSNFPIYIKEEDDVENITNENIDYYKKSKIEETVEIKNEDKSELNRIRTRKKTIQHKFEEESDGCENINDASDSENEKFSDESDSENIKEERETMDEKPDWKCETCDKTFKKVETLGLHMKKIHKSDGVKCRKCSIICYHPLHLRVHEKSHNRCRICNLSFSTLKKLSEHKLTHENDYEPEIFCELCPTKFTNKHGLYKHMRFVHKIEKIRQRPKCDKCGETFQTKRTLLKHIRKMHKDEKIKSKDQIVNCEICGKSFKRRYLGKHMITHAEHDNLACEFCAKIFKSILTLKNHVRNFHKNSGPVYKYLCNQCGLKLRTKYHLDSHLLTHTKERPFACDKCDKTYRTSFRLKEHKLRFHLNQRNFVCTFCSLAFYDKKILLAHVRRHTGEKPFKCHMCDKRFIQEVALKAHMKVHMNSM
ncbi:zinc finger protein 726-like [Chrysoperla carnea]|uniref:zinc finger protein 726-like n=1 Tax=Chrysoperla carnea TaxID=189513 RepID=UPI001D0843DA|nr:zinc finger protein 726-like [Chrysoperla carnea]